MRDATPESGEKSGDAVSNRTRAIRDDAGRAVAPTLPGRSPIVVTLPAAAVMTAHRDFTNADAPDAPNADAQP